MRLITFATMLALFVACTLTEGGDIKGSATFFPTEIGTKWVYDVNGKKETEQVVAVEKAKEGYNITVDYTDFLDGKTKKVLQLRSDGLYQTSGGPAVTHPPMLLVKLPHKDGQKWSTWLGAWGNGENRLTAHGPEKIEVPAGKFEAIRVVTKFPDRLKEEGVEASYWYAPRIGLVKKTYGENKRVLKSFSLGS